MEAFYVYILQVNVGLIVFYLLYRFLFSRDTFLQARRLFLLTVLGLAFLYPVIDFSDWNSGQTVLQTAMAGYAILVNEAAAVIVPEPEGVVFSWQNILLLLWGIGSALLLIGGLVQMGVVFRMAIQGKRQNCQGIEVIALKRQTTPFSFFKWIFVNPVFYEEEGLAEIIAHEKVHVREWHSVDTILSKMLCICFWFNPFVWLLQKEICQNLEFLADKKVIDSGYNRKNYQYHLLRLSTQPSRFSIVNNFNISPLKKRIIMMNKQKTSKIGLIKYAMLLPVTGLLILSGNGRAVAEMTEKAFMSKTVTGVVSAAQSDQVENIRKAGEMIEGKVVDENGKPIRGVSVIVKGTNVGTVSMEDGSYAIKGFEKATLVFSYVGKETLEVTAESGVKKRANVTLAKKPMKLEEVVVVGYGYDEATKPKSEEIFVVVEEVPQFSEGEPVRFIAKNIKYPARAAEQGVEGRVMVSFVVNKEGKVTEPKVVKSVHPLLDREAMRVIQNMPDWKPGKQRGVPVDVEFTLPVEFHLQKNPDVSTKEDPSLLKVTLREDQAIPANVLYVIDGKKMPKSFKIDDLKPADIESLTVLKDKNATAEYGEDGRHGVIVITMKKADKK